MSDNRSLDSLFKLVHSLKKNMQVQIESLDLDIAPMHVRVLKIISKKPQCTAIDIAHFLDRDKAQVTRLLSSLFKQELIVKEPNPEDKRSQCLRITSQGQEIMEKISGVDKTIFEKMAHNITTQELDEFERVSKIMVQNLRGRD